MNKEEFIYAVLDLYKCASKKDEYKTIPIWDGNELIGFLKPITYLYKKLRPQYIDLICKWREEHPEGFANRFKGTHEKTERWIDNVLLPRKDRILFVIHIIDNTPIGHIGLSTFDFKKSSCEIDNVVRGVKEGNKGIMTLAMNTLIEWVFDNELVDDIYLKVLSDNTHAIKFYEKNKFQKLYDIPLFKIESADIIEWVNLPALVLTGVEPDKYYTYMKYGRG